VPSYSGEHSGLSQYKIFMGQLVATYLSKKSHHNLKVHDHVLKCTKDPVLSSNPYSLFLSLIGSIFAETLYSPVEAQFVPYFCMFGNVQICGRWTSGHICYTFVCGGILVMGIFCMCQTWYSISLLLNQERRDPYIINNLLLKVIRTDIPIQQSLTLFKTKPAVVKDCDCFIQLTDF